MDLLVNADLLHLRHQHLQESHDGLEGQLGLPAQHPGRGGRPGLRTGGGGGHVAHAGTRGVRYPRVEGRGGAVSTSRLGTHSPSVQWWQRKSLINQIISTICVLFVLPLFRDLCNFFPLLSDYTQ